MEYEITSTRLFAKDPFPNLDDIDWLIIMGGPMGIYDEDKYPLLFSEKNYIEQAVVKGKIVLGICLGAQLIADVLGERIYPTNTKKLDGSPFKKLVKQPKRDLLISFQSKSMLSTGMETLSIFPRAQSTSPKAKLETMEQSAKELIDNCQDDIKEGPFIQSSVEIFSDKKRFEKINLLMSELLNHLSYVSSPSLSSNSFGIRTMDQVRRLK